MYYKIQKSLGKISAIPTDSISPVGICIEFNNYENNYGRSYASIIIYQNGSPDDVCINGCTFPSVYNDIEHHRLGSDDIYGGKCYYVVDFEFIDSNGKYQHVESKDLYGENEALAVEYFYSLLYNISCCKNMEQYEELYKFIIDNIYFSKHKDLKEAVKILNFVENFSSQIAEVNDTEYLVGLKQKISAKFKEAQNIISISNCPI